MHTTWGILGLVLMAAIIATPAAAFTVTRLTVNIAEDGDAGISVDYSLSWAERAVVLTRIAHPQQQLENALEEYSGKTVQVVSMDQGSTELYVEEFADRIEGDTGITYRTPAMHFTLAERMVQGYWFSRFVKVDASPATTTITFPDGYEKKFFNLDSIPPVTHQTGTQ
jgi:hypothetical protein